MKTILALALCLVGMGAFGQLLPNAAHQVALLNQRGSSSVSGNAYAITNDISGVATANNFTGWIGWKFTNETAITVTHLSRWVTSGNSQSHLVAIVDWCIGDAVCTPTSSTGPLYVDTVFYASNTVNTAGQPVNAYADAAITPISLPKGIYMVISFEFDTGDQWLVSTPVTLNSSLFTPYLIFNGVRWTPVDAGSVGPSPNFRYTTP